MKFDSMIIISSIMTSMMMLMVCLVIWIVLNEGIVSNKASNECKQKYPNEKFCDYIKDGIACGSKCKDLNLEFYHYESGGIFATDDCSCINQNREVIQLY